MERERFWVGVDWSAPEEALTVADAYVANIRFCDPVELCLATGSLPEPEAAARVAELVRARPAFAIRAERLPELVVVEGEVPADVPRDRRLARSSAAASLRTAREELASYVAVTPVRDRAEWASRFAPQPGFLHLVSDNASSDRTGDLAAAAGARVVRQPVALSRLGSWRAAIDAFATETDAAWLKWLFAGDELLPEAADVLDAGLAAHPEARLVVCEYLIRDAGGRLERWRTVGETRLLEPADSLLRSATDGNWFGAPIAHLVHRDAVADVEFGCQPWVADWQACLSVAARHPVLYIAEPIGIFDMASRRYYSAQARRVGSLVQELSLRLQSLERLREWAEGRELSELERRVHREAALALARRVQEHEQPDPARPRVTVVERDRETRPAGPTIAVHAPRPRDPGARDFNGYAAEFAARHARYAYVPRLAGIGAEQARHECARLSELGLELVTDARELDRVADVLVCFEGRPYVPELAPPGQFSGLKAYHTMDFVFHAGRAHQALVTGGVDIVLGYARHDQRSPFFAALYPSFAGRVLTVPFGFSRRFEVRTPFAERSPTVLGIGSVNPVDDPLCAPGELAEYIAFHPGERWTHRWRRTLVERSAQLEGILTSRFPVFPQTKDPSYDAVAVLNAHAMFANDEGLMAFPPARTYEGPACGALLVAADSPALRELGFRHDENALLHRPDDVEDFRRVVTTALAEPERLAALAAAGTRMVRERYTHEAIADRLHDQLCDLFAGRELASEPAAA